MIVYRQAARRCSVAPIASQLAARRSLSSCCGAAATGSDTIGIRSSSTSSSSSFFHKSHQRCARCAPRSTFTSIRRFQSTSPSWIERVNYNLPQRRRNKVVTAEDAVSLVSSGDTVCVSGFVCQGAPEHLLKALGDHYAETGEPHSLTLFFGGGPGDYATRGLNHLAKGFDDPTKPPMLRRAIGGHYGQCPKICELTLSNKLESHILPMGSISRMIRAQATHAPGHITTVGIGTFLDPDTGRGGAINELAMESEFHKDLITRVNLHGHDYLLYKALPIDVALIRATTGDSMGNLTMEDESLLCDQMITAAAARNSGGLVLAQVKRLAAVGSLQARSVRVPGPMVDAVVVVPDELHAQDHPMSYLTAQDPVLTNQIRTPVDEIPKMPLTDRKVIARRAAMELRPGKFVNLGIGLADGVAAIAGEEGLLEYLTLTTEPGVVGGLPATGREFGPAANADALIEMNQMFDFYNGGIIDICYLGAAQINPRGDVNVSRLTKNNLTGPGGFLDITNTTPIICFMGTFTAKGLDVELPGDGTMKIKQEGKVKKYVNEIFETTFSGDEAVKKGQVLYFFTERCVFRRTAKYDTLELLEIAPGVDLEKDVLAHMEFKPVISPNLKIMDERIFKHAKMEIKNEVFGSLEERCTYNKADHSLYVDLFGVAHSNEEDVYNFYNALEKIYSRYSNGGSNPINVVVNYDGFDVRAGLEELYGSIASEMERKYFKSVKRYGGKAFRRAKLGKSIRIAKLDPEELFDKLDREKNERISTQRIREGMLELFNMRLTEDEIAQFSSKNGEVLDNLSAALVTKAKFLRKIPKIIRERGFDIFHH